MCCTDIHVGTDTHTHENDNKSLGKERCQNANRNSSSFLLFILHSEELQDALGVTDKSLPPFIYRMRQLGYPPGWLKEAELENSGLALYDGNGIVCQDRDVSLQVPVFPLPSSLCRAPLHPQLIKMISQAFKPVFRREKQADLSLKPALSLMTGMAGLFNVFWVN